MKNMTYTKMMKHLVVSPFVGHGVQNGIVSPAKNIIRNWKNPFTGFEWTMRETAADLVSIVFNSFLWVILLALALTAPISAAILLPLHSRDQKELERHRQETIDSLIGGPNNSPVNRG
jgi:hypothetical protein